MKRQCEWCETEFETSSARARFCGSTCRSRANRAGKSTTPTKTAKAPKQAAKKAQAKPAAKTSATPADKEHAFVTATRKELDGLEALDTMLGQQILTIAERMGRGAETGSAMASLSKEHSRLMGEIRARAKGKEEDPVEAARKAHDENVARATQG